MRSYFDGKLKKLIQQNSSHLLGGGSRLLEGQPLLRPLYSGYVPIESIHLEYFLNVFENLKTLKHRFNILKRGLIPAHLHFWSPSKMLNTCFGVCRYSRTFKRYSRWIFSTGTPYSSANDSSQLNSFRIRGLFSIKILKYNLSTQTRQKYFSDANYLNLGGLGLFFSWIAKIF